MAPDSTDKSSIEESEPVNWPKRVGWLILIWSLSVLSLGVVAYLIRTFMTAAGMIS